MATRDSDDTFDRSQTWVAEMFMSSKDAIRHHAEIERLQGITPEVKRLREIKAGVITASAGFGLMILLFVLMNGIIASGRISEAAAEILSRLWIVGIIPLLVGAALVSTVCSSADVSENLSNRAQAATPVNLRLPAARVTADTNELGPGPPFSVVDQTTRHLQKTPRKQS